MNDTPALAALVLTHLAQASVIAALAWAALRNISAGSALARLRLACAALYGAALLPLAALLPQQLSVSIGQGAPMVLWVGPIIASAPTWLNIVSLVLVSLIGAGIVWRFALTLLAVIRGERLAMRATKLLPERFGLPDDIRISLSQEVTGPVVAGLLRPTILLPPRLEHAPRETLFPLIHHEFAHLIRRDVRNALTQRIVEDVFWWNPAMRLLGRWLDEARELACDDMACATTERRAFAGALVAEARTRAARAALAVPASGATVIRRLERLIEPRAITAILSSAALALIVLFVGAVSTPRLSATNATHIGIASS